MFSILKRYKFLLVIFLFACNNQQIDNTVNNDVSTSNAHSNTIHTTTTDVKMVYIPGGEYKPFYGSDSILTKVAPYLIDERAVTNAEFLAFIKDNPQWRRSNVKRIYADTTYLKDWQSDVELPKDAKPNAPICYVSWFAAKAYAHSVGKRLPTLDEWEFMAMADETSANAREKVTYSDNIISLYLLKGRQFNEVKQTKPNYWGVYNVFDLIWEWTDDFNSILTTNDSRSGQYEDKSLFCAGSATSSTDVLNYAAFMRFALRTSVKANYTIANLGFRCAKDTTIIK
jgi:sulfatase modifying factor 1